MKKRILRDFSLVSLEAEKVHDYIDFEGIFGRKGPVHIEIGSGKGTFLVSQAKALPEINFLGIEWANKYYRYAVDRIGRHGIENVRIMRTDAASFITEHVPDSSVSCYHIYFPDPWPKKRHNKRRFFCNKNLSELVRTLMSGGIIQFATDHADYFEQAMAVLSGADGILENVEFIPASGALEGELVGTNYERKYIKEQRDFYTVAARKMQCDAVGV